MSIAENIARIRAEIEAAAREAGRDPKEIDQCFIDLEYYLEKLSLEENNAIFKMVCRLCSLHEEKAFKDGLRIGAYLMLELQGE